MRPDHRLGLDLFMTDPKTASSQLHWAVMYLDPGWQDDVRLALGHPALRRELEDGVYDNQWWVIWDGVLAQMGIKHRWVRITAGLNMGLYHLKLEEEL